MSFVVYAPQPSTAKPTSRWDDDDSDDDVPPVPPGGSRLPPRNSTSLPGWHTPAGVAGGGPTSPLLDSGLGTSAGRGRERENRIVMGLDYGTTATGEPSCTSVSMTHN